MTRYECDKCGACCQGHLIVEANELDLLREPRLATADPNYRDQHHADVMTLLQESGRCLVLACGTDRPCPFLDDSNTCSIYPTRPNACVAMQAGDEQCQAARKQAGLPMLEPATDPAL